MSERERERERGVYLYFIINENYINKQQTILDIDHQYAKNHKEFMHGNEYKTLSLKAPIKKSRQSIKI